jgi:hypothetical protein
MAPALTASASVMAGVYGGYRTEMWGSDLCRIWITDELASVKDYSMKNSPERNIHGAAQVGKLLVAVFQRLASICQWGVIISISARFISSRRAHCRMRGTMT